MRIIPSTELERKLMKQTCNTLHICYGLNTFTSCMMKMSEEETKVRPSRASCSTRLRVKFTSTAVCTARDPVSRDYKDQT